ncbi:MAG: hypothetical protein JW810_02620, partial [Sedimentisphaerales bacterium]|nr:hypothetical protein [Sedimentisphaerales bacterium]
ENIWSEIVVPTINMFGAFFYTQIPTILVGAILMQFACSTAPAPVMPAGMPEPNLAGQVAGMAAGAGGGELELALWAQAILTMTTLGGMFFLPMVLLILSFDAIGLLLRPDLIVRAIGAIWKPYLLGWLCLLAGVAVFWLAMKLVPEPEAGEPGGLVGLRLLVQIPVLTLDLAVFLYAMRVIGLLYLHFQHLLPWTLEKKTKHPLEE